MQTIRILLVDDEKRFVLNLAKLLQARGFDAYTAFEGRRAVELITSEKNIALVLLDVRMPGMDGMETLQWIKQRHPDIEVIMLTGQATMEDGVQALRLGAFDFLQKPCDIESLMAKIAAACSVERIRQHQILWPRYTAGEIILTGFIPLFPEDTLDRAFYIFNHFRNGEAAQMLFVVDDRKCIKGKISRKDLLCAAGQKHGNDSTTWEWMRAHPERLGCIPVKDIMDPEVYTVAPETRLTETAELMLFHRYASIPVASNGVVLGIIRLRDVLRYMQALENPDTADQGD